MTATPAGPTLTGNTDPAGDPIVQTGSGLVLTNEHLTVLASCATSNRVARLACGTFPTQVAELQRDLLLSSDTDIPGLFAYGYNALVLAGWK